MVNKYEISVKNNWTKLRLGTQKNNLYNDAFKRKRKMKEKKERKKKERLKEQKTQTIKEKGRKKGRMKETK